MGTESVREDERVPDKGGRLHDNVSTLDATQLKTS